MMNSAEKNSLTTTNRSIAKQIIPQYYAAVFGFGANMIGTEGLSLLMGFRFTYGVNDLISKEGGKSQNRYYPMNDSQYTTDYKSYKATNPLTVRFIVELNFDLGFFAKSKCGKGRKKFVTF